MNKIEKKIREIENLTNSFPQLCHASNILGKFVDTSDSDKVKALEAIIPQYSDYLETMLGIKKYGEPEIEKRVNAMNEYSNFIHRNGYDNLFSAQGKFRSTILEEFLYLFFNDYVDSLKEADSGNVLDSGAVKAYSNIYFKAKNLDEFISNPEIGINQKNQDYAIYRKFMLSINNGIPETIYVPALAIEAKTYIDKTMLDSIIATAEKIKSGNPHSYFIAVCETYDVSMSVDPAYSRIDQIYVLRKSRRKDSWKDIQVDVVTRMFHDVKSHFERPWSDIEERLQTSGTII